MKNIKSILLFALPLFFISCDEEGIDMGNRFIEDRDSVYMETFTVKKIYTVRKDSFPTNELNTRMAFVGKYRDFYAGETEAVAYLQFGYPFPFRMIDSLHPVFDSITMEIAFGKKYWNHSLAPQTYSIHRMADIPKIRNEIRPVLYNTDTVGIDTELGSFTITPRKKQKKISIRLKNEFGLDIFHKLKNKDKAFDTYFSFIKYLKGIAIKPAKENDCMIALNTAADSLQLRLHYHNRKDTSYLRMMASNSSIAFNGIRNMPPDIFSGLKTEDKVKIQDSRFALMQPGNGYLIRIEIPNFNLKPAYTTLLKAELEIYPEEKSADSIPLPPILILHEVDEYNRYKQGTPLINYRRQGSFMQTEDIPVSALLTEKNKAPLYVFDLTNYVQQIISKGLSREKNALIIAPGTFIMDSGFQKIVNAERYGFERLVTKKEMVLKLYYSNFYK